MTHIRVLGIDIAKEIFHVVDMDDSGTVVVYPRIMSADLDVLCCKKQRA